MTMYHVSHDGVARICRAQDISRCRLLGNSIEHFDTKEDAQKAYEKSMENNTFSPLFKKTDDDGERFFKNVSDENNPWKRAEAQKKERYDAMSPEEKEEVNKRRKTYRDRTKLVSELRKKNKY